MTIVRPPPALAELLGNGGRNGPETFVVAKLSVAPELRALAREMDRL